MTNLVTLPAETKALAAATMRDYASDLQPLAGFNHRVSSVDKLVPVEGCQAVIQRIECDLKPAGDNPETGRQVTRLLASYPPSKWTESFDTEFYRLSLIAIYAEHPASLHGRATTELLKRYSFYPDVAKVHAVFEELKGQWVLAKFQAQAHLREHQRRKALPSPKKAEISPEQKEAQAQRINAMIAKLGGQTREKYSKAREEHKLQKEFDQDRHRLDQEVKQLKGRNA